MHKNNKFSHDDIFENKLLDVIIILILVDNGQVSR